MTTIKLRKTFASLPRTSRGQFTVLNGDPKGKNFLYCNGSQVFIRNIEDMSICDIYTEHARETTVAKYSPSGSYIASGDKEGKVRVWDTINPEHILKKEHHVLGSSVKDVDWSSDNGKIVAVGDGMGSYGKVFTYDSGNSVGEVIGHGKCINAVSMKPSRPFKIVTGSEDYTIIFYEGPPFKFSCTKREPTNFVNCIKYSPSGDIFIGGGSDGKLWIYDGKTSDYLGELGEPKAHKGGIYAISFSADSKKLLSVSGDKTAKIWDIESKTCDKEFVFGNNVSDMQVGCLWEGDHLLTLSLTGYINVLDPENPASPKAIIKGHNKPITALAVDSDGSTIYSAGSDGSIIKWDAATSSNDDFKGKGHTNQVNDMVLVGDSLVSVGMDDTIRFSDVNSKEYGDTVKLDSQPRSVDSKNNVTVVACINHITVFQNRCKASSLSIKEEAFSVGINPNGTEVVVGMAKSFVVYSVDNGVLKEIKKETVTDPVMAVCYSPDGSSLGVSSGKFVQIFNPTSWEDLTGNYTSHHTAKVTCLSWSPDSRQLMSGSIDSHIVIWELGKLKSGRPNTKAHPMSFINKLKWLNNNSVVTAGQDSNLKIWDVSE